MPVSVTLAYDMWTNPPKASCTFEYKYEGDALPTDNAYTNLGFFYDCTNEVWNTIQTNGNVKYLFMDRDTHAGGYNYYKISNSPAWQPTTYGPFTVDIRARVVEANYSLSLIMKDGAEAHGYLIYTGRVATGGGTFYCDTTNTFHTYRFALWSTNTASSGQRLAVWRDGVLLGEGSGVAAAETVPQIVLGCTAGSGSWARSSYQIDYLRWTTNGAYPWKDNPPAGTSISVY